MADAETQPVLADDASNPVTTLTIADEPPTSTTVPLLKKKATLDFWTSRRDLHDVNSKTYKSLATKVEQITTEYQREMSAWQGRKLMEPARRLESKKRRAETMEKKRLATVQRIVEAVEKNGGNVKDKVRLAKAVAAALEPPEPAKATVAKKQRVVEEEDD